jgi:hypothetical protein
MGGQGCLRREAFVRKGLALATAATAGLLLATGCGGDSAQSSLDVKKIAARVERIRGLTFKHLPEVKVLDKDDFAKEIADVQSSAGSAGKADLAEAKRQVATARQFVFLTGLLTPKEITTATSTGGDLAGLYVFKTNDLLVLNRGSSRGRESTAAHELTHALEDQAFGSRLTTQLSPLSERAAAYHSLLEGSATLVQLRYEKRYLGAHGTPEQGFARLERKATDAKLPELLTAATVFPYAEGGRFVLALERHGGWKLVDKAHRDPPTTTSSIIHPARFLAGERPVAPSRAGPSALGEGWTKLGTFELGELDTRGLLRSGLSRSEADRIAAGWAGGVVEAFRRDGAEGCTAPCRANVAIHVGWTWRSAAAATAFSNAMPDWFSSALSATPQGAGSWKLRGGAAAFARRGRETHLAFAPSAELARRLAGG